MFIIAYLTIGAFVGLLSGLLGIGGGIVLVPCLLAAFHYLHFNQANLMHLAVATSFAVILITTLCSYQAHRCYHLPYQAFFFLLAPGVIIGSICGVLLSHFIHTQVLKIIFGIIMIVNSLLMILPQHTSTQANPPSKVTTILVGFVIGGICSMVGISGSVFIIPYLNYFKVDMHVAVIVSVAIGIVISSISIITYFISGLHEHGLPPHVIGYIYWPAWLAIIIGSSVCAPLGAHLSHNIAVKSLRKIFCIFFIADCYAYVVYFNMINFTKIGSKIK